MATEFFYDIEGRRIPFKQPELLPRVGDQVLLTQYGRIRATRHVISRVEWTVAQEESPAYFNRPRQIVVFLDPAAAPDATTPEE